MDNLGCSLPLLFKISAVFLLCCAVVLYFVYNVLCRKCEDRLIKMKEEEILKSQRSEKPTESVCSKFDLGVVTVRNNHLEDLYEPKTGTEKGNCVMYLESQTKGKTKF